MTTSPQEARCGQLLNTRGGAIGHPFLASGVRIVSTLAHVPPESKESVMVVASVCIGQCLALVLED